jgi:riboflavin kinase / FMN adenylyltransferase
MLVTRDISRAAHPAVALTIGNFDGVHQGHQAILKRLFAESRARGLKSCVMTFEPHPREFFGRVQKKPEMVPTRLTSLREKIEMLAACGVDRVHVQRFSAEFAQMSPEKFVHGLLHEGLKSRWVLIGDDFCFGTGRSGNFKLLRQLGAPLGIEAEAMNTVAQGGIRVSSVAVREALSQGNLDGAARLLGRNYSISGRVVHGDKFGRQLGYATANVQLRHNRPPLTGIFAVRLHGLEASGLPGVASLGVRPTVKSAGEAILEVHLFDFNANIYGRHVRVEFLQKIRDEEKFPDVESLREAIGRDCAAAREILMEASHG